MNPDNVTLIGMTDMVVIRYAQYLWNDQMFFRARVEFTTDSKYEGPWFDSRRLADAASFALEDLAQWIRRDTRG